MCAACAIKGHDKEDHAILAQSTSPVMDPLVKDAVDRQIDYAREALNEAFDAFIESDRTSIESGDYQAMSIMNKFFEHMMK